MIKELLPCPFCGDSPRLSEAKEYSERRFMRIEVECCVSMDAVIPYGEYKSMSPKAIQSELENAVTDKWNTRIATASDEPVVEATFYGRKHEVETAAQLPAMFDGKQGWLITASTVQDNVYDTPLYTHPSNAPEAVSQIALIKMLADRFMGWKFPKDFSPDGGISFEKFHSQHWPTGTNLINHEQAKAMFSQLLNGLITPPESDIESKYRKALEEITTLRSRTLNYGVARAIAHGALGAEPLPLSPVSRDEESVFAEPIWQEASSAPRDGSEFMAYFPVNISIRSQKIVKCEPSRSRWVDTGDNWQGYLDSPLFTNWKPLDTPPSANLPAPPRDET